MLDGHNKLFQFGAENSSLVICHLDLNQSIIAALNLTYLFIGNTCGSGEGHGSLARSSPAWAWVHTWDVHSPTSLQSANYKLTKRFIWFIPKQQSNLRPTRSPGFVGGLQPPLLPKQSQTFTEWLPLVSLHSGARSSRRWAPRGSIHCDPSGTTRASPTAASDSTRRLWTLNFKSLPHRARRLQEFRRSTETHFSKIPSGVRAWRGSGVKVRWKDARDLGQSADRFHPRIFTSPGGCALHPAPAAGLIRETATRWRVEEIRARQWAPDKVRARHNPPPPPIVACA